MPPQARRRRPGRLPHRGLPRTQRRLLYHALCQNRGAATRRLCTKLSLSSKWRRQKQGRCRPGAPQVPTFVVTHTPSNGTRHRHLSMLACSRNQEQVTQDYDA